MRHSSICAGLSASCGLLLTGNLALADGGGIRFSDFTPLTASAGPTADEAAPITFGNPAFEQRSIADRATQLAAGMPNSGNWDMNTVNENGQQTRAASCSRCSRPGKSGVQRHDLKTGKTDTIWHALAAGDAVSFDASFWTPWGTLITAEESPGRRRPPAPRAPTAACSSSRIRSTRPRIVGPLTATSNDGAIFVHQNVIPRTSHEGIQFDKDGNMYFIDELNGGCIYKYTPAAPMAKVKNGRADYFAAGQTFVLRVGDGNTPNATGAYTWVPFTDAGGAALPGAITITDIRGVTSVDARNTTDLAAFKGTDYQRPEDMQIQRVRRTEYLYVTTTTTNEVYAST